MKIFRIIRVRFHCTRTSTFTGLRDFTLPPRCNEMCTVLGCYTVQNGNSPLTFRDKLSGPIFKVPEVQEEFFLDCLTLKDGTRQLVPKRPYVITIIRCVRSRKNLLAMFCAKKDVYDCNNLCYWSVGITSDREYWLYLECLLKTRDMYKAVCL